MEHDNELRRALEHLRTGGFTIGPEWDKAHAIAQAHEGEAAFDRLHALCHRIEGDDGNAGYWYRRAGATPGDGTVETEWRLLHEMVDG